MATYDWTHSPFNQFFHHQPMNKANQTQPTTTYKISKTRKSKVFKKFILW